MIEVRAIIHGVNFGQALWEAAKKVPPLVVRPLRGWVQAVPLRELSNATRASHLDPGTIHQMDSDTERKLYSLYYILYLKGEFSKFKTFDKN
mgnify:CR=1 FL=1